MTITLAVGCWLLAVSFLFEKSNRFPCFFAEQKNIRICLIFCLFFVLSGLSAQTPTPSDTNHAGFLLRTTLYRPGDHNSKNYRIPAIVTAGDGSLVVATDKRKYNDIDLPEDIDILVNRSTDGGRTWSQPLTLAEGTGVGHGFGDCALVRTNEEGGLIAVFVGGVGFWQSRPDNPLRTYLCRSHDYGRTWSQPKDITHFILGPDCVVPEHRSWWSSFFASGAGLRTSSGRLMFVAAVREDSLWMACNYLFYSDDDGETWQCSQKASPRGDEAKVVELSDGRILMSIRAEGHRLYNISEDGGITWRDTTSVWPELEAPACNGDIIRCTAPNGRMLLLHSLPYGKERKDVSIFVSFDEGKTWPVRRTIVPYPSAYSSLCQLPDGTIGLYVEEAFNNGVNYSMVFYNFSLEWLLEEKYRYISKYQPITPNYTQAMQSMKNNDYATAYDYLEKELAEHPKNGYAWFYKGWLDMYYKKAMAGSLDAFKRSVKLIPRKDKYFRSTAYSGRGVAHRNAGNLKAAYADFSRAIKLYPNAQDYINRGEWNYSLGNFAEAQKDFLAALELDSNNMDAWYSVGKYYYGTKDYGKCLEWLADCIARFPDYSDYYMLRALCYREMHDYDHVAKDVVQALSIDEADNAIAMLRELADSAYRQTITELEARHLADPNNTGWIYYIAAVHEIAGEYGKALLMYKKLYDMDEKGSRSKSAAAERIAACWWQLGDNDNAIRFLEEAIALEEDKDEKAKISSELEYVREHSRDYQKNEELESIRKAFFGEN